METKTPQPNFRLKYDQDVCGAELLKLVARGSAIIAEILRLKDHIPDFFLNSTEEKRYSAILFDFSYFKNVDDYDNKILNNIDMRNMDEDFRENYLEILERFFNLFYSIYQYITDWESYIEQVKNGVFVQHTIETILMNKDIRHLLCESIFLYGVMLLLCDRLIPGIVREKMMIAYYRYKGQSTIQNFQILVQMFKNTEYSINSQGEEKKPFKYPCDYFSRYKLEYGIIKMIVGIIKDSDIYDQIRAYPSPDHRSHALTNQAAILFVILYFVPDYLELENAKMREIVDKHFSDNWVISYYMGYTADILDYWKDYKAAKNALSITINSDSVKVLKKTYISKIDEYNEKMKKFLAEGLINEDYVLDNINNLLNLMRESNVVLRWIFLQRTTSNKKYRESINQDLKINGPINLLLSLSHFEYVLKQMFQKLIENKESMWNEDKQQCIYRLQELSDYFAGNKTFGKQVKQDDFKEFFLGHLKNLQEMTFNNSTSAGRKIILVKESLDNIKMYHYIEGNLQIKQYLNEITQYLNHMLRIVNIKKQVLVNIAQISDFSYAWIVIQEKINVLQNLLKQDFKSVLLLRATFLKLASILNFPLVRIIEADSPDFTSVSNYYSGELVKFVSNVLQIVPLSVFDIHDNIIKILNKGFKELPIKVLKSDLKDYAQPEERYQLSKCTHQISLFTKSILMMEKTLMGVIEVDPKNILEDGIRKELLNLLAYTFNTFINFCPATAYNLDFHGRLNELSMKINSIKKSFIYIQDYINIDGTRIWYEESHRLINYNVDFEGNAFLNRKIRLDTKYNTLKYPIPKYAAVPKDTESITFIGRLLRYMISITKPKTAVYYPSTFAWYDTYSKEIISIKTFNLIKESLGIEGYQGLYRLLGYMNYNNIVSIKRIYNKLVNDKNLLKSLKSVSILVSNPMIIEYSEKDTIKALITAISAFSKQISGVFVPLILNIGHLEIFKSLITHCLKESVEMDSNTLDSQMYSLNKMNLHLLKNFTDLKFNNVKNENQPQGDKNEEQKEEYTERRYYKELCRILEDFGFVTSSETFYYNLSGLEYLVMILSVLTFNEVTNAFVYDKKSGAVYKKNKNDDFDLYYFIYGIFVILNQMGRNNIIFYISFISFMIKNSLINQYSMKDYKGQFDKIPEVPSQIIILQVLLQELSNAFKLPKEYFDISINPYLAFKSIIVN